MISILLTSQTTQATSNQHQARTRHPSPLNYFSSPFNHNQHKIRPRPHTWCTHTFISSFHHFIHFPNKQGPKQKRRCGRRCDRQCQRGPVRDIGIRVPLSGCRRGAERQLAWCGRFVVRTLSLARTLSLVCTLSLVRTLSLVLRLGQEHCWPYWPIPRW
jgi:hypothetical protein